MRFFFLFLTLVAFSGESNKPWKNKTELGLVGTDGNSQSQSWGFSDEFEYRLDKGLLEVKVSAVRVDATRTQRKAIGTNDDWSVLEEDEQVKTAENYRLELKYNHTLTDRSYWFGASDWASNKPAGIKSRTSMSGGLGHKWKESERTAFKTDYGLQYTQERPIFRPEDFSGEFASLRLSYALRYQVSKTSKFKQELKAEASLQEQSDFLAVLNNQLNVAINAHLALKVGGSFRFDNEPAFIKLNLYGSPNSSQVLGTVPYQKESLDSTLTTSLVFQF